MVCSMSHESALKSTIKLTTAIEPEPTLAPKITPSPAASADPEEIDISTSEHFFEPSNNDARQRSQAARAQAQQTPNPNRPYPGLGDSPMIDDEMLKAMMLGMPPPGGSAGGPQQPMQNPFAGMPGMEALGGFPGAGGPGGPNGEDPMMAMLQQMMGAGGAGPGDMPGFPGMPPLSGQAGAPVADKSAYLWRIVHAVFALSLGVYIALTVRFTGTKLARAESALVDYGYIKQFFWAGEAVLLGRFLFKGQSLAGGDSGILGMVLKFIPHPYGGYIRWIMRYSTILRTIAADALLVVFALGVVGWWNK